MIGTLQLTLRPPHNHRLRRRQVPIILSAKCAITKQGDRFLTAISTAGDASAANRLIGKFVASSPKSIALNALSHLLSPTTTHPHLSSLALPLYSRISEASWFNWNPKLVADLVALLDKRGQHEESEALISEAVSKFQFKERELVHFYCNLVKSHSEHNSSRGFDASFARLNLILCNSSSVYVKRRAYESMVSGLCAMNRPREAENLIEEMRAKGFKPSVFEFRTVLYGYGKLGLFEDMERIIKQMVSEGFEIDTICSNMVLSAYGAHNKLTEMISWIRKMKTSSIPLSARTYNSVLNSCPTVTSMLQDKHFPLSMEELYRNLTGDEALLVMELSGSSSRVLEEAMKWDSAELKLDLHGMHLGSAYLIMLEWMEAMRRRFEVEDCVVPAEVTVVCGLGKHSSVRGESPVKSMVKEMMVRMRSPLRIDRKNIGCFVAKGKVVKDWLFKVQTQLIKN